MLVRSDIHRSIGRMTIDLHRAIGVRSKAADLYKLTEREFQAQYDFSGSVGSLPVEADIDIPFTILFAADPGQQRDSTLDRPHVRITTELQYAPAGAVPHAYLKSWSRDDDFNYVGATVAVGMTCPALFVTGATPPSDLTFKGIVHAAFQGWACQLDGEGALDAGGTQDDPSLVEA